MLFRKNDKRKRSKHSEKQLANLVGGKVQPASGALPVASFKGDVQNEFFLFDDKTTVNKSFGVKIETLRKLRKDAFVQKRKPVLRVRFEAEPNAPCWYVISEQEFLEYLELKRNEQP